LGDLDVLVKLWSEVVQSLLGGVEGRLLQFEVPGVVLDLLGDVQRMEIVLDFSVLSEVGNGIVKVIAQFFLGVLVLSAASGGANGVRLNVKLNIFVFREGPFSVLSFLAGQVTERILDIGVEGLFVVVNNGIGRLCLDPLPVMTVLLLGPVKVFQVVLDILVFAEVGHEVVFGVIVLLLWVHVLITAGGRANGV